MSPQTQESFPVAAPGTHQIQKHINDIEFLNYHFNHDKWAWYRMFDITEAHRSVDDFDFWDNAEEWDYNEVEIGQGSSTAALTDMVNGVLLLTTAAGDNDLVEVYRNAEAWKLVASYPLYAEIRFKCSDATQTDIFFGLIQAGPPYSGTITDGVYFRKDDGDANIDFVTMLNTVAEAEDTTIDLEDTTWIRLGFHWDGDSTVRWFVIRDADRYVLATGSHTTYICQDEELVLGFALRNGEAVVKYLWVDYVKCVQKRAIE